MKYIILSLFILTGLYGYSQKSQKEIDSLLVVAKTSNDSVRLRIQNKASFFYIFNDLKKAKQLLDEGIQNAQELNVGFSEAELTNTLGIYYDVAGVSDSAKVYFEKALHIAKEGEYDNITSMVINNLGMYNWNQGNFNEALQYFFEALEFSEIKEGKGSNNGVYLNNIGLIYQEMYQWDKALEYHEKALAVRKKFNSANEIPASLNNLAIVHKELKDYEKAEEMALKAIDKAREAKSYQYEIHALTTLGNLYVLMERYTEAIDTHKWAISKRDSLNFNLKAGFPSLIAIMDSYNSLGKPLLAKDYFEMGEALLEKYPFQDYDGNFNSVAAEMFYRLNDPEKGKQYLEKSFALRDSLFSSENASKLAQLETRFKVAEKERNLAETRAHLAESELKIKQRNNLVYGSLSLAIILGLLGYLFYNRQKLKNRQLKKEGELKEALAKIETQNKLQEQRLRISRDLHDNIGSQLTFVTSSVDNLKFKMKGEDEKVTNKLGEISAFTTQTIYELRDTIWAMNKTEISFEDLQTRIANFIDKAGSTSDNIDFSFKTEDTIAKHTVLSSIQGMNMYRIIQEAINNALKYAEASKIDVTIVKGDKESIVVTIKDNGKGFRVDGVENGNGINNMKKRAKDIGGKLDISSKPEEGTQVVFHTSL